MTQMSWSWPWSRQPLPPPPSRQLTLRKEDIANLKNEVLNQTGDISTSLDGVAQAPLAVSMINTLTTLAACMNDCSLDHPQTKDLIKLLKTLRSFKASLVQVVHEATKAFVSADSSTSRMKMELAAIPNAIFGSIEAASQPNNLGAKKILEVNKMRIDKAAHFCADQAEGVAKQFEDVTNLLNELVQATIAIQELNENQMKEIKKKIDEIEAQKKLAEEENQRVKEEILKQEERTKEAREEYKEKAAKMGSLGHIFFAAMVDSRRANILMINEIFSKATDFAIERTININTVTLPGQPKYNHNTSKHMEIQLLQSMEGFLAGGFPEKEEIKSNLIEQTEFFKEILNFKPTSLMGKNLHKATESYYEVLSSISDSYDKLKTLFKLLESAVETARKEMNENTRVESEKLKASAGTLEQIKNAANTAQGHYRAELGREDELNKDASTFRREIAKLAASLNTAGVEKLDLQGIIEYISKVLVILSRLQESWREQAKFFRAVANTVSGPLKDTLSEFIDYQNTASAQNVMLKKKLLETAMKGCGICYQVMKCFEIYQELSTKYVLPKIAKATGNLQLSKVAAQTQLSNVENEYAKTEEELLNLIKSRKEEIVIKTENEIRSHIKKLAIIE